MARESQAQFDACSGSNQLTWTVMVTWGHGLRQAVEGVTFSSEQAALQWIEQHSAEWLEAQNALGASSLATGRDREFVTAAPDLHANTRIRSALHSRAGSLAIVAAAGSEFSQVCRKRGEE
jgi:hypothetical protein